jgi:DNA invertase Pin-like site-specific DNA recombinase
LDTLCVLAPLSFGTSIELEAGEVEAPIFTNVDRSSRCTEDFAQLIRLSEEEGWRLIVTGMGIDTRIPTGKVLAHLALT